MRLLLLAVLFMASTAHGANPCRRLNEPCSPAVLCCAPLACTTGTGKHCVAGGTTTTVPGTVTSTTVKPPTTTTVPPPPLSGGPLRFDACALGLSYPLPIERKYDPRTGKPGSEYTASVRVEQAIFEWMPRALRVLRDVPSCAGNFGSAATEVDDNIPGRLFFKYGLQRWRVGDVYFFTSAQYDWEYPQKLWRDVRACVLREPVANFSRPELTGEFLQLLRLSKANGVLLGYDATCRIQPHQDGTFSFDGAIDPSIPGPPLTTGQCQRLKEARAAHHANGAARLKHNPEEAASTAANVKETQLAFEGTARSLRERTLFSLIFIGDVDPKHTPEEVDQLTMATMGAYDEWADGFRCGSGLPPDVIAIVNGRWKHARAHFLRAIAGVSLTEICPGDIHECASTAH